MTVPRKPSEKIKSLGSLASTARRLRRSGKKIVFTNGCFDVLHVGHVRYLAQARRLGGALVVALNSDASVRGLKGPGRPVCSEKNRAEVLASLECVDAVTVFSERTPERVIRAVKPDFLVKGGDWKKKDIVGADFVESYGGRVKIIPFIDGFSTTRVLEKIKKLS